MRFFLLLNSYIRVKLFTMGKIKMVSQANDAKTGQSYPQGTILDLGEERNTNAVNNGLAIWVEDITVKNEAEKKEETPKKTTSSARGKKIDTK